MEDLAIGPRGFAAVTTNSGQLLIFDPAGESTAGFTFDPSDPPLVIEAPDGSPAGVTWLSLARRSQWLRGHGLERRGFVGSTHPLGGMGALSARTCSRSSPRRTAEP